MLKILAELYHIFPIGVLIAFLPLHFRLEVQEERIRQDKSIEVNSVTVNFLREIENKRIEEGCYSQIYENIFYQAMIFTCI